MKVAVSIPDDLFEEADRHAEAIGASRSAVYAEALRQHLRKRDDAELTRQINEALKDIDQEEDLAFVRAAGRRTLARTEW